MKQTAVIILAAGLGTRMRSQLPKVLHKISGQSMINHILNTAYNISNEVIVVLHHHAQEIQQEITKDYPNVKIHIQDLKNYPGTAGAVFGIDFKSIKADKILITAGDMPLIDSDELRLMCQADTDVVMSTFMLDDPNGYGRVITKENQVIKIVEQKDATDKEIQIKLVNAGAYVFKKESLVQILPKISNKNAQLEYYLTDCIAIANNLGFKCTCVNVDKNKFIGINDKYQLAIAEEIMQNNIKKELMKNGIIMHLPNTIYIDSRAKFIGECEIESGVVIKGETVIESSKILSNSVIENAHIISSNIGPMARIRPNSIIKDSKIGNFVETKAAILNGVKAGHLSYLGDCEIQDGTNIGCGTITCNYDGKNKYRTIIGKNVFIGSNSNLIAPLNIQDNSLIAAGSTITTDVKEGNLAIARAKQINKPEMFYKFFKVDDE